jgi:5-deoxy-glucuronate isomerase
MPQLWRPPKPSASGCLIRVTREQAGWERVSYAVHRLPSGANIERPGDGDEVAVLVLEGTVDVDVGTRMFAGVGGRATVFDPEPAAVVLVEPGASIRATARSEALVGLASAPGGDHRSTRLIPPSEVLVEHRGSGVTSRRVHHLLPPSSPAGALILFEVVTPGGHWSSYPPHKHDTFNPPEEYPLEELYHYRFRHPAGFAIQRIYARDDSLDLAFVARDNDLVTVDRGYHPVCAAAGYDAWYLNVMAGPVREWRFSVDPDHIWLMDWRPPGGGR